ncbi:hypothetical protein M408DRAFT_237659 [Serendipita vermifera MAFF 305830]|uniref:Uncharacterized protein n=1 Tax=Serendipita vermifera MAFF 305830 TaxID=933852 RepID=A0A0C2X0B3_SERVB|nr:hypothetical protein M408DRAFT_237659 [Serendipita vermifera MAFF 305830]
MLYFVFINGFSQHHPLGPARPHTLVRALLCTPRSAIWARPRMEKTTLFGLSDVTAG